MISSQPQKNTFSVSELNRQAKTLLETHFDWVQVEGEIGDFTAASSGHWYFTLKDAGAQVRCAMFKRSNGRVNFNPGKGDVVKIRARVTLYEGRGEFQLICEHMTPAGDGALQLAFDRLKQQLADEGLFAQECKKNVPQDAQSIGIITSATGAALQDILTVLKRRSPRTAVYVLPVPVQGKGAATAIVQAIEQANTLQQSGTLCLDLLIVGRGGGSLEDLWSFNEEIVARAIAVSALPIVSAVGHEIDFSIADFVADLRAPTPSAAAEMVTTDQQDWMQKFDQAQLTLGRVIKRRMVSEQQSLKQLRARLRWPGARLQQQRKELAQINQQLQRQLRTRLTAASVALQTLKARLSRHHQTEVLTQARRDVSNLQRTLSSHITGRLQREQQALRANRRLLESLSPLSTLERGYAIVTDPQGCVIRDSDKMDLGSVVAIRLARGKLSARIEDRALTQKDD